VTRAPSLFRRALTYAALLIVSMVVLYPVLLVLKKAFEPGRQFALSASPVPTELTLDHFRDLALAQGSHGELLFLRHAFNSALVALATTVVGVILSCTAAYALSRFRFPGRRAGLTTFLVVQMFPASMLLLPLYVLLDQLHLLNSIAGLVMVYATTAIPFCVWTLKGYFDSLPRELEEAARMDGASAWGVFFKVVLPLARPGLAVTALFSFMTAWNEFILASVFLEAEAMYTAPVGLRFFVGGFTSQWGFFAAGSVIVSLPVVILFLYLQKYLVSGLTAGSVK